MWSKVQGNAIEIIHLDYRAVTVINRLRTVAQLSKLL